MKADTVAVPEPTRIPGTDPVVAAEPAQPSVPASEQDVPQRTLVLHFAAGRADLTDAHKAALGKALDGLSRANRIVILGRTDSLGSESLNQSLALARGLAVRHHLLDLAPDFPAPIAIDARGRCCYSAGNDTSRGRAINRRVELVYASRAGVAL